MRQDRLTDHLEGRVIAESSPEIVRAHARREYPSPMLMDIDPENLKNHPLWAILVDTARRNPLYAGLASYTRNEILPNEPNVTAKELATMLSISVGEALVLLEDLRGD